MLMSRKPTMVIPEINRINILGVGVDAIDMETALKSIQRLITEQRSGYITVIPAHTVIDCQDNPTLRKVVNASHLATPDGMSVVWLMNLQGHKQVERVYGPDLFLAACQFGLRHGWRHTFYGGEEGVGSELSKKLCEKWPELEVVGAYSPPFRPLTEEESEEVVTEINASRADIVWVGLGSPKQELWMAEHLGRINAPVMIGVGAAFDFLSGVKSQAPVWIQRSGLEWLFRLATEPKRLWPRYRKYPKFVMLVLLQLLNMREFPMESDH
jgi:N-acetylglucosaminyldiphosphoundecaprenol N-acetyl-beta-D-mannosaminyltransferase